MRDDLIHDMKIEAEDTRNLKTARECLKEAIAEIERLRAAAGGEQGGEEIEALKAECLAKGEALVAMQKRLDWAYSQRDSALQSHEGQLRNTLAFKAELDALRAGGERGGEVTVPVGPFSYTSKLYRDT